MNSQIIVFNNVASPVYEAGAWYCLLENGYGEELKILVDEPYVALIEAARADNEKFVKTHFKELGVYNEIFNDISIHLIQYDIEKCYTKFELYVKEYLFRTNLDAWLMMAFAKAYRLPIICSMDLWYEIVTDLTRSSIAAYRTTSLVLALPLIRKIADDEYTPHSVRSIATKKELLLYEELAKRQRLSGVMGSLMTR